MTATKAAIEDDKQQILKDAEHKASELANSVLKGAKKHADKKTGELANRLETVAGDVNDINNAYKVFAVNIANKLRNETVTRLTGLKKNPGAVAPEIPKLEREDGKNDQP